MTLDLPNLPNVFKNSPEDGQILKSYGKKNIPEDDDDTQIGTWLGTWGAGTGYVIDDLIEHIGALYICKTASTNNEPPNTTYWNLMSSDTLSKEIDFAGTAATDNAVGTRDWTDPNNIKTEADFAIGEVGEDAAPLEGNETVQFENIKIIDEDGTIGSENKGGATQLIESTQKSHYYGGIGDLWSRAWTVADINNANFGIAINTLGGNFDSNLRTYYLKATNFGFEIPSNAIISGIRAEINTSGIYLKTGTTYAVKVYYIKLTIFYTF